MKITKRQLKRLIKEERRKLNEGAREMAALLNGIDAMRAKHNDDVYIADVLREIADEIESGTYDHGGAYDND
jgi:hypothetical protein